MTVEQLQIEVWDRLGLGHTGSSPSITNSRVTAAMVLAKLNDAYASVAEECRLFERTASLSAGTAATATMTLTGTITALDAFVISYIDPLTGVESYNTYTFIAPTTPIPAYSITIPVGGMTTAVLAAAINGGSTNSPNTPANAYVTAVATSNSVVTLTAITYGTNGNAIKVQSTAAYLLPNGNGANLTGGTVGYAYTLPLDAVTVNSVWYGDTSGSTLGYYLEESSPQELANLYGPSWFYLPSGIACFYYRSAGRTLNIYPHPSTSAILQVDCTVVPSSVSGGVAVLSAVTDTPAIYPTEYHRVLVDYCVREFAMGLLADGDGMLGRAQVAAEAYRAGLRKLKGSLV